MVTDLTDRNMERHGGCLSCERLSLQAKDLIQAHLAAGGQFLRDGFELATEGGSVESRAAIEGCRREIAQLLIAQPSGLAPSALLAMLDAPCIYVQRIEDLRRAVADLIERTGEAGALALDIETQAIDGRPRLIAMTKTGLAKKRQGPLAELDPARSMIRLISLYAGSGPVYVLDLKRLEIGNTRKVLEPLLALPIVIHNATFDTRFLLRIGLAPTGRIYDTMTACLIAEGEQYRIGLDAVVKRLFDLELAKEYGAAGFHRDPLDPEQIAYAGLDAVVCRAIWVEQRREIARADGQYRCRHDYRTPVFVSAEEAQAITDNATKAAARIALTGMPFDVRAHSEELERWRKTHREALNKLHAIVPGLDPAKPEQIRAWLKETLSDRERQRWPKTDSGAGLSVDYKTLGINLDIRGIREIIDVRKLATLINNFGEGLAEKVDRRTGRLHSVLVLAGARTGRTSARNPNLQQMPSLEASTMRRIFKAPPGKVIVAADYSQIELRVLAGMISNYGNKPSVMTRAFADGLDAHTRTAADLVPPHATTEQKLQARAQAKVANFGLTYGMGERGFHRHCRLQPGLEHVTFEEAKALRDQWFRTYADVGPYQRAQVEACRRQGYVATISGRRWTESFERRLGNERRSDDDWVQAGSPSYILNFPIQGSAAECMLIALAELDQILSAMRDPPGMICASVHDELVFEAEDDTRAIIELARLAVKTMTDSFVRLFPKEPISNLVDVRYGPTWAKADLTRVEGL